jgi:hypothetical protein
MKIRFLDWIVGMACVLLVAAGCTGGGTERIVIYPEYKPEHAVIFDDLLAPELFGFDPEGRDPAKDPKLEARTLRADLILPARVETMSRVGGVEKKGSYELVLSATGPALYGEAPGQPLILNVGASSPTYPWVDGAGARWVGTRLILFVKRFRGSSRTKGDIIHFRGEPDTVQVRTAIHRQLSRRVLPTK